jgi:hypothetical protein
MFNDESKHSDLDPSTFYSGFQIFNPTENTVSFVNLVLWWGAPRVGGCAILIVVSLFD